MKRYLNEALLYAVLSLVGGVFYREFTKIHGFVKKTTLEVVHTHYFILGMIVLLLLLLLEKKEQQENDHTEYDRSLAAPSSGKEFFFHQCEDRSDPGGLSCRSEFDRCDADGAWSDSGTRNRSFFRHGRCYLRYGWHRTHPSGSKLGSLVTSDPAQHI